MWIVEDVDTSRLWLINNYVGLESITYYTLTDKNQLLRTNKKTGEVVEWITK